MLRRPLGLLVVGIIILIGTVAAGCSPAAPNLTESAAEVVVARDIKVYESPT